LISIVVFSLSLPCFIYLYHKRMIQCPCDHVTYCVEILAGIKRVTAIYSRPNINAKFYLGWFCNHTHVVNHIISHYNFLKLAMLWEPQLVFFKVMTPCIKYICSGIQFCMSNDAHMTEYSMYFEPSSIVITLSLKTIIIIWDYNINYHLIIRIWRFKININRWNIWHKIFFSWITY